MNLFGAKGRRSDRHARFGRNRPQLPSVNQSRPRPKEWRPILGDETEVALVDSMNEIWIVGLYPAVSTHPYLADRRGIEIVHNHCHFNSTFRSSNKG